MSSKIYIIRHAESVHNITKDFSLRDPGLTPLGLTQASALATTFPALSSIGVIITSPLRRTVETTLAAFGDVIGDGDGKGGVKVILESDLQERSDLPCDTGSETGVVKGWFEGVGVKGVDFSGLGEEWFDKGGRNKADDASVAERARAVRERLREVVKGLGGAEEGKRDVVVVTHGVFMKFLTGDEAIDLPKAGWRVYTLGEERGEVKLVEA